MPKKQLTYDGPDYEPDTDMPDTSDADNLLEEGGVNSGIGKLSALHTAEDDYKNYLKQKNKARSEAAKSSIRTTDTEE